MHTLQILSLDKFVTFFLQTFVWNVENLHETIEVIIRQKNSCS